MIFNAPSVTTGGTLTVTAPAGVTVTVSKDGRTKTKTADSSGITVFKGLKTGTWTVTITDGTQTATKPVVITTDYSTIMAFFAATINVTYPAGSTCTATDGTTTLTAPDTSGTWACVVPNAGTWTITATNGEKTKSGTVTISTDGETASITLAYVLELFKDGKAVVPWSYSGGASSIASMTAQYYEGNRVSPIGYTAAKVDVTGYSTLTVKISDRSGDGEVNAGVTASAPSISFAAKSTNYSTGAITMSIDVSKLTGEYYIAITASANWNAQYTVKTTDVYLV